MKILHGLMIILISILFINGCNVKGETKKKSASSNDTVVVSDTGYTGISRGMSGQYVVNEISYKNGVKDGLMKTFYKSGKLRQTFWYVNGLRQDSSRWYYEEGQLFRTTPYVNDTIDGVQKQFYRTGKIKAKLIYSKGFRTPFLQEFDNGGKLVTGYPELVVKTLDEYNSKGLYRISLELSNKSTKARYFRGEFYKGVFDTARVEKIKSVYEKVYLDLKKTGTPKSGNVGIIAEILTDFGNNLLVYKKIDLPYNDLD